VLVPSAQTCFYYEPSHGKLRKISTIPVMISSHEVRWFLEGGVDQHPALRRWVEEGSADPRWIGRLGGKPDVYCAIPGAADMGIKWREGQLQIKGLECSLGTQKFTGSFEGRVERWFKWGYEGKPIEDAFTPWFTVSSHTKNCGSAQNAVPSQSTTESIHANGDRSGFRDTH